jgi:hypothetical protein
MNDDSIFSALVQRVGQTSAPFAGLVPFAVSGASPTRLGVAAQKSVRRSEQGSVVKRWLCFGRLLPRRNADADDRAAKAGNYNRDRREHHRARSYHFGIAV